MTDTSGKPERNRDDEAAPPGIPGWVKISAAVVVVLVLVLVLVMAVAGGEHGPGLHTGAGDMIGALPMVTVGFQ